MNIDTYIMIYIYYNHHNNDTTMIRREPVSFQKGISINAKKYSHAASYTEQPTTTKAETKHALGKRFVSAIILDFQIAPLAARPQR